MEYFASFPLTGAQQKTTSLMNEHQKKSKISCCATTSETHDENENEGDDESEYYEIVEDEDEDGDGYRQDGNEDKQQHGEDKNEEQSEKSKGYLANQQACAHDFDRVKLHDVQIRSLKDRCAHMQEHYRIEKQARVDLQLTVEKLTQTVKELQETVQSQREKNRRNKEHVKWRLDALETDNKVYGEYFNQEADRIFELQTAVLGPKKSQS
ncbi:hypothetical protein THARTR1_01635 [Trichoderma harzianum]|uniref:Uncharacterized protein n=1 Tax=Trichoderma harzianum TaxID=5544 RepID=A0A2K0ULG0_TRIHA|nr:hypothetical protein THARTR1_01635 [Trichoderma harzianum]